MVVRYRKRTNFGKIDDVNQYVTISFPTANNIIYYKFDESSGTTLNDSKWTLHWTTSGITRQAGKINNGWLFDWTTYITLPQSVTFNTTTATWNIWVKNATTTGNVYADQWWLKSACLFDHWDWTTGSWIYAWLKFWFGTDWVNKFRAGISISNGVPYGNLTSNYVDWWTSDTNRHMLTFTLTGTTTNIYFDGNATPISTKTNHSTVSYASNPNIYVWCNYEEYTSVRNQYFSGMLDEFGIWSRVLSTTEISDLYNSWSWLPYA